MGALCVVALRRVAWVTPGTRFLVIGRYAPIISAKLERLAHIGRERLAQRINLRLNLNHRPGTRALLQDTHMSSEKIGRVQIEVWFWRCESDLRLLVSK